MTAVMGIAPAPFDAAQANDERSSPRPTAGPSGRRRSRSDLLPGLAFLAPFLVLLILFQYVPLALLARNSLHDYSLYDPDASVFVGAGNYVDIFTDPDTINSFAVTAAFAIGSLLVTVPLGLALAMFLNTKLPGRAVIRTMVFLPVITSTVVASTLFQMLLGNPGLVNQMLASAGIPPLPFLTSEALALPSLVVMASWQQIGLAAVLFLGGLQAVPHELLEASRVDGASGARTFFQVVLPLLSRSTLLVVVLVTTFSLQVFAPPLLMTQGGPDGSTNFVVYHLYRTAFLLQSPGTASAIAIVLLLIAVTIALLQSLLLRTRWNY